VNNNHKLSNYISYDRLKVVTETCKPYRGRENVEYPYYKRAHGNKYFTPDMLDNELVYRIMYGHRHIRTEVSKDVFDAELKYQKYQHTEEKVMKYYIYIQIPYEIGIVRPDNSFEFTTPHINQSEITLLNNILFTSYKSGFIQRSVRHGGVVIRNGYRNGDTLFYPIAEGMRVDIATHIPREAGSYKIVGRRVNRKSVNDLLGKYKEMFLVTETMMKTMSSEDYLSVCVDLVKEYTDFNKHDAVEMAESTLNKSHMLDAFIMFAMATNADNLAVHVKRRISDAYADWWVRKFPNDLYSHYTSARRAISKCLYKQHEEVMKEVEFEFGKKYPSSEWGYEIYKNGVEIEQY